MPRQIVTFGPAPGQNRFTLLIPIPVTLAAFEGMRLDFTIGPPKSVRSAPLKALGGVITYAVPASWRKCTLAHFSAREEIRSRPHPTLGVFTTLPV